VTNRIGVVSSVVLLDELVHGDEVLMAEVESVNIGVMLVELSNIVDVVKLGGKESVGGTKDGSESERFHVEVLFFIITFKQILPSDQSLTLYQPT